MGNLKNKAKKEMELVEIETELASIVSKSVGAYENLNRVQADISMLASDYEDMVVRQLRVFIDLEDGSVPRKEKTHVLPNKETARLINHQVNTITRTAVETIADCIYKLNADRIVMENLVIEASRDARINASKFFSGISDYKADTGTPIEYLKKLLDIRDNNYINGESNEEIKNLVINRACSKEHQITSI